jgi:hypothetical protein
VLALVLSAILTLRRGIWAGLIAAAASTVFKRRPWLALATILLSLAAGWMATGTVTQIAGLSPSSIALRTTSIREGLALWRERPMSGWGWAWWARSPTDDLVPYNLFVNSLAAAGILGGLLVTSYLAALLVRAWRSGSLWVPFLVFFCVLSTSEMTIFAGSAATLLFFFVAGAIHAAPRRERK